VDACCCATGILSVLNGRPRRFGRGRGATGGADFEVTSAAFGTPLRSLKRHRVIQRLRLTVDSELRQNPTASRESTATFRPPRSERSAPGTPSGLIADSLRPATSRARRSGLGIVQGFTTALTNVTGTAQATIDVTRSA